MLVPPCWIDYLDWFRIGRIRNRGDRGIEESDRRTASGDRTGETGENWPAVSRDASNRTLVAARRAGPDPAELLEHRLLVLGRDADPDVADRHLNGPLL